MNGTQRIKLWWAVLTFLGGIATAMAAEEMILRAQGSLLNFTAPRVHYLSGRPLERMKNAAEVDYDFRVTLAARARVNTVREKAGRFRISYALWEERFKIVEVLPNRGKTKADLTAEEAEAWCVQEMSGFDVTGIDANQQLWVRMEIWAEDEPQKSVFGKDNITEDGISLNGLVEKLSPWKRKTAPRWTVEAGPITLEQLRRR
jgi:hypothetical protein